MVSRNEDQTIKLEMTIDRAELERQLGTVFQGPGGVGGAGGAGGAGGRGGRAPGRVKPTTISADGKMSKDLRHMRRLVGIYFGINAMVKSSQVLSTTLGALSQTLGAVMDSFLAPLIPHLIPVLTGLAKLIPKAADAGATASEVITDLKSAGKNFGQASPFEKDKMIIQTLGASIRDLAIVMVPFSQKWGWKTQGEKNVEDVRAAGGTVSNFQRMFGTTSGLRKDTFNQAFGPETGMGRMPAGSANALSRMSDAQLTDFLSRQANNGVNINVYGDNIEDILSAVRSELETVKRDASSGSSLGNN